MNRQTRQDPLGLVTRQVVARRDGLARMAGVSWVIASVIASLIAAVLAGLSATAAHAAPVAPLSASRSQESKPDLIVNEDSGSRIEELRVGSQTRSIHVQTKGKLAGSYEILPVEPARDAAPGPTHGGRAAGQRVWKLLTF